MLDKKRQNVWVVIGTRPEAIKMCPVVKALKQDESFNVTLCFSGQHPDMVAPVLNWFGERADVSLSVMSPGQTLAELSSKLLKELDKAFSEHKVDAVLVHGDTSTSTMAALAAYYHKIPVGHVEAGLRTESLYSPWPEEANRRLNGVLSTWHFAPTLNAARALKKEGVSEDAVFVTGNTVIDALFWSAKQIESSSSPCVVKNENFLAPYRDKVLITAHRRENHNNNINQLCLALQVLAAEYPDVAFVYPVHPNPNVSEPVKAALSGVSNILLLDPQPYDAFVALMKGCRVIVSDSGGIQEEAPALGVPVLVCRDTTERPEAV